MAHANSSGNGTGVSIRNVPGFTVRLTERLRHQLELAAQNNGRSLQKEIVARLEASLIYERCDGPARYATGYPRMSRLE